MKGEAADCLWEIPVYLFPMQDPLKKYDIAFESKTEASVAKADHIVAIVPFHGLDLFKF